MKQPLTDITIAKMIQKHDICPLPYDINYQGRKLNAARRLRIPKVRDRIEAVRFAKDSFGFEASDAVLAGVAASVLVFGTLVETTTDEGDQVTLEDELPVPVDVLIDQLEYGDFQNLSYLMGKPRPSSESPSDTSKTQSES
ncbi:MULTISPECIES: hypothetical protein [Aeromonas]|uniref:hypothetical protein n=1 Tax=Aeromonas TaxID=642 RepID=UPI000CDE37FD|nr:MULTISPECIES: hypothetical protein [Aeromonas]AUZ76222.1 hypothetical protein C2U40_16170 [Aeromonas sp. ASNIH4]POU36286.1 hypothetical protein C3405_17615 [Aeromonas hydrophila]POV85915.1 hypothetical protein C3395_21695 [Aeromonas sp. ASNIH6]